ncbi:hypothetical protein BaRGS_00011825, partial [Batillaria attramentaria]
MLFHNSLFYCLLILPAAMCFGASVESPDPNTAVNTTTDAPSEQQDVEHSTTNRVVYHSPANQQVSQSVCENDIKATNQEVWELRQQVQMLKLKQDMTNLRSEMKDLTGHVTCGQPRPDPGDTVTNAQQTTAAAQSDPQQQDLLMYDGEKTAVLTEPILCTQIAMLVLSLLLWVTMSTLQWGACENTEDPDARNVTTNSATATTEETETETREAQRADHERPASYSQYGNQYSACENEMKATNQEVWELRQQVQMLQLKQDMTSLRSELRDLKGHVSSRQPHLGPRDTVTHTEHRDTNQQMDSVTNDTDPAVRPKKAEVKLQATSGSVYVRWGGQTCPDTASLVYS